MKFLVYLNPSNSCVLRCDQDLFDVAALATVSGNVSRSVFTDERGSICVTFPPTFQSDIALSIAKTLVDYEIELAAKERYQ